ncbi:MAG TPA: hypothetical protein VF081_00100 [Solirubrobacterales bacterium]
MSYAVLAHRGDTDAELLARELALRDPGSFIAWEDELFLGSRFTHRLDEGGVGTEILCAGGRRLDSASLLGLACRLTHTMPPQFASAPQADRDYAAMESHALLLSWLQSLPCPVVNPASPRSLNGPAMGLLEWLSLAAASGLRSRRIALAPPGAPSPYEGWEPLPGDLGSATTALPTGANGDGEDGWARLWAEPVGEAAELLVVGERVLGGASDEETEGYARLARRAGCSLLGVHVAAAAAGDPEAARVFCGAETMPRLGPEGAAALADLMTGAAL